MAYSHQSRETISPEIEKFWQKKPALSAGFFVSHF
jgi:hypothetical protein